MVAIVVAIAVAVVVAVVVAVGVAVVVVVGVAVGVNNIASLARRISDGAPYRLAMVAGWKERV